MDRFSERSTRKNKKHRACTAHLYQVQAMLDSPATFSHAASPLPESTPPPPSR